MSNINRLEFGLLFCMLLSFNLEASVFGTSGLIDIPTARMLDDGAFKATLVRQDVADITNITYQATPFLETTFRYTIFNPRNVPGSLEINGQDRSYALKVRLLRESKKIPQISIGVRDFLGTGQWGSEYLVASKKFGNLEATVGLGWGRLSERGTFKNPLIKFGSNFENRSLGAGGEYGGETRFSSFFSGEKIGLFGGLSYKIDNYDLKLLAEYNSDSYLREINFGTLKKSSPINIGLKWEMAPESWIGINLKHGDEWGVSISSIINTKEDTRRKTLSKFYSSSESNNKSSAPEFLDLTSWYDRMLFDYERSGLLLRKAKISDNNTSVFVEIENKNYQQVQDALRQAIILAELHVPKSVSNIQFVMNQNNFRTYSIEYKRKYNGIETNQKIGDEDRLKIIPAFNIESPTNITNYNYPSLSFGADISGRVQLFDPDKPLRYQYFLKLTSGLKLKNGWSIWGAYSYDLHNNFSNDRKSDSIIEHVRSDINLYLTEGSSGIDALYLEKRATLKEGLFLRGYAGILEEMYSGFGGEILFRPFIQRWAIGANIAAVKQRDYRKNFNHLNYSTITGYVSAYYASPFYNFDFALHMGRYLARDKGYTIEVRRSFDNGFSIGAFATFTDISAAQFGEGSFDKGLFFKIPFNAFTRNNTRNGYSTTLRSLTRDGGQRLPGFDGILWHELRDQRYDAFEKNKNRMIP